MNLLSVLFLNFFLFFYHLIILFITDQLEMLKDNIKAMVVDFIYSSQPMHNNNRKEYREKALGNVIDRHELSSVRKKY